MTKIVVIIGFVVSFAAGLIVGVASRTTSVAAPATTRPTRVGWLASELNLTREQQAELTKIWSDTADRGRRQHEERRRQLRRDRDEAIEAIIRPEDKGLYDQVQEDYVERVAALEKEMRSAFDAAVERTRQVLTPEQRAKYEALLRRQQWDRGPGPGRHHDRTSDRETTRRGGASATSKPSS